MPGCELGAGETNMGKAVPFLKGHVVCRAISLAPQPGCASLRSCVIRSWPKPHSGAASGHNRGEPGGDLWADSMVTEKSSLLL